MLLSRLVESMECRSVEGFSEREISDVTESSHECSEQTVFVAVRGTRRDGNDYISEARRRGCKVFVSEKKLEINDGETLIFCKNARKALAEIAKLIYGASLNKMKFVGITGTKGKTATAKYTAELIFAAGKKCVLFGTLGVSFFGVDMRDFSTENTTVDSVTLYKSLGAASELGAEVAIIEVSSQALTQSRVYGIPFDVCVFTNFSKDHIGEYEHKNLDEYFEAKRSLFRDFGAGTAIVNSKDKRCFEISRGVREVIFAEPQRVVSEQHRVRFQYEGKSFYVSTAGAFNAENATLALAVARKLTGLDLTFFAPALANTRIRGRFEAYTLYGKTVIIDFAHNAASFEAVISEAKSFTKGKLIVLFGSVGGRCYKRRRELAEISEKYADISVITSDNPDFEEPAAITEEIYGFYKDKSVCRVIPDRTEAVAYAVGLARAGDTVLLLGKGHERFQLEKGVKRPFSERALLISMGADFIY